MGMFAQICCISCCMQWHNDQILRDAAFNTQDGLVDSELKARFRISSKYWQDILQDEKKSV